jgi:hypothetical protein
MSIVLDALRRGRRSHAQPPPAKAAQTDAVLHTLGYRQTAQESLFSQVPGVAAILAIAVLVWIIFS